MCPLIYGPPIWLGQYSVLFNYICVITHNWRRYSSFFCAAGRICSALLFPAAWTSSAKPALHRLRGHAGGFQCLRVIQEGWKWKIVDRHRGAEPVWDAFLSFLVTVPAFVCVGVGVLTSRCTKGQEDSMALIHFLCWRRTEHTGNNSCMTVLPLLSTQDSAVLSLFFASLYFFKA